MLFCDEFYNRQINKALKNAQNIDISNRPKIVMFSDCHRGNGSWSDNFLNNKVIYQSALSYYYNNDFTYIELGDGDELWENRQMKEIEEIHKDIFEYLMKFMLNDRFFMLWGNHDRVKSSKKFKSQFFPKSYEALILVNPKSKLKFNLMHGHQVDLMNNQFWKVSRWLVRYIWRPLELLGVKDPTSAARNYSRGEKVGFRLSKWASDNNTNIICGHTHRPSIPKRKNSIFETFGYYNTGSCVHPNAITCIELVHNEISLVKWTECADENGYIHACKKVIDKID